MNSAPAGVRQPPWRLAAAAFAAAHLLSYRIQADVPGCAADLDDGRLDSPVVLGALLVAGLAMAAAVSGWLGRAGFRHRIADQVAAFGRARALTLLLASALPQRLLDANAGFVHFDPDSALGILSVGLDVVRGLAAANLVLALVTPLPAGVPVSDPVPAGVGGDQESAGGSADRQPAAFASDPVATPLAGVVGIGGAAGVRTHPALVPAVIMLVVGVFLQFAVLGNVPRVSDEIAQDWEARLLATGRLHSPEYAERASFFLDRLEDNGRWLSSIYQSSLAVIWSLALRFGMVGLVNPLLMAAAVWLWVDLLRRTHGDRIAHLVAWLLAISPFALMMAGGRMNHVLALGCQIVAGWGLVALANGRRGFGLVLGVLGAGMTLLTRQLEGFVVIAAFAVMVATLPGSPRQRGASLVSFAIGIAAVVGLQLAWCQARSGDPWSWLFRHQAMGLFATVDLGGRLAGLLSNSLDNLLGFQGFAFGGLFAGVLGLTGLRWRRADDQPPAAGSTDARGPALAADLVVERFSLWVTIGVIVGYATYTFQDFCYGPRYWFPLLPGAALGAARWLAPGRASVSADAGRRWLIATGLAALVILVGQAWSLLGRDFWHIDPRLDRFVATIEPPALVFRRNPVRPRLAVADRLRRLGVPGEVIMELVSIDSLDFDGLLADLASWSAAAPPSSAGPGSRTELVAEPGDAASPSPRLPSLLARYRARARRERAEQFDVNEIEVIRLNSGAPLTQSVVLALDLGDTANEALIRRLPRHRPWLLRRHRDRYLLEPYQPAGVPAF